MATHAFSSSSTPEHARDHTLASDSTLDRWALWFFVSTLVLNCIASAWALLTI